MSEKKIKVTDKRLFTPDGELKNEFRHLEDEAPVDPPQPVESTVEEPTPEPVSEEPSPSPPPPPESPPTAGQAPAPSFFDLVGVVAQPIALYLGDAKMPDGESLENLEMARLYIDLLDILYKKTAGNVSADEAAFLKDLLYQLRLRYVEKTE